MRDYTQDFNDICKLMRKYIEQIRPQSFASVYGLFGKLKRTCERNNIKIQDVSDIEQYAKKERIERYGFVLE